MAVAPQETEILHSAINALKAQTGLEIQLERKKPADNRGSRMDGWLRIKNGADAALFAIEVKSVDRFQTPAQAKAQLQRLAPNHRPLLVAPYITREVAERCRALHLSFADTAGNAFIEAPGFYVYVVGQPRPKSLSEMPYRSLDKAGLQITFTLLARPEILRQPYRNIAEAADVALGTMTPVMRDLGNRGLLRDRPTRKLLDPQRLFEEWVTHYPITLRPKLNPRRFAAEHQRLDSADLQEFDANWSGEMAAEKLTGYLRPAFFSIYARQPIRRLITALRLRAEPNGNVEMLDRFWNFPANIEFPDLAPPILVYADLMASGDGRNMEAAQLVHEQRIKPAFKAFAAAG